MWHFIVQVRIRASHISQWLVDWFSCTMFLIGRHILRHLVNLMTCSILKRVAERVSLKSTQRKHVCVIFFYFLDWLNNIGGRGMTLLQRLGVHNSSALIYTSWATFTIPKQKLCYPNSMEKTGKPGIQDSMRQVRNTVIGVKNGSLISYCLGCQQNIVV